MNLENVHPRVRGFLNFITSKVLWFSVIGILLITLGQISFLYQRFPEFLSKDSAIYTIIKLIGGALLGSGVFTAIIKSSEYTDVFTTVIEKIIGSKEFIAKRTDKKEFWKTVSSLLYEEKFPDISEDLQDIITNHYFPTAADFYLDNYSVFINITDVNANFWKHHETIKFTIKSSNPEANILYEIRTMVDLPHTGSGFPDITEYVVEEISVNGQLQSSNFPPNVPIPGYLTNKIPIKVQNNTEYKIVIKQYKVLCKKSNPDKKYFASYINNNLSVTILMPLIQSGIGNQIELYRMGTVKDFVKSEDQVNNNSRIVSWEYKGLILPHQGYFIIFK